MSWTGRVLVAAGFAYGRAHHVVERCQGAARGFAGAFLGRALDLPERTALSIALYDATPHRSYRVGSLFEWEERWLRKRLPPPPARVLGAAAGAGREAVALARLGYDVHAFDPAPSAAGDCSARLESKCLTLVATYEDLSATILDGVTTRADAFRKKRYDAVLLGWGSLSHVLDATERKRALRACTVLAPTGPLLCTFPIGHDGRSEGRSARLGRRLGEPLTRLRRVRPSAEGDILVPEFGFRHQFTQVEIDELADHVGRHVAFEPDALGWRCVTFLNDTGV